MKKTTTNKCAVIVEDKKGDCYQVILDNDQMRQVLSFLGFICDNNIKVSDEKLSLTLGNYEKDIKDNSKSDGVL